MFPELVDIIIIILFYLFIFLLLLHLLKYKYKCFILCPYIVPWEQQSQVAGPM